MEPIGGCPMSDGVLRRVSHVASVLRPPLRAVCLIRCAVLVRVPCEIVETHRHTTAGSSVQARLSTLLGPYRYTVAGLLAVAF